MSGGSRDGRPHGERVRDAVVAAVLPGSASLPGAGQVDLRGFWPRFQQAAPVHVRLGFRAAVVVVGEVMPRLLGHRGSLDTLDDDTREAVVVRCAATAGVSELLEVAKIVACLAYFTDGGVQAAVRGRR